MSTRSTIGVLLPDGTVEAIYCHFDGYPQGVGKTLELHYSDPGKVRQLMQLGHLSSLGEEIGVKQDFRNPIRGMCLAYGRDRGKPDNESEISSSVSSWLAEWSLVSYAYLYANGKWSLVR